MTPHQATGRLGRVSTLFTGAFAFGVVVLALLGSFGLADAVLGTVLAVATLTIFVIVGIHARTMHTSLFYLAGRAVPDVANGMASAAAFLSGSVFLGLAGVIFADAGTALALTLGWSFGFLMLAVLLAPYFRKSGAFGVADFLAIRYGGRIVRLLAVVIVALSLIAALAAALATATMVGVALSGMASATALTMATAIVLCSTVLGGMRAVTLTGIIQYIVLALAFVAPAVLVSMQAFSLPIPALTFGYALEEAAALTSAGADLAAPLAGRLLPFAPATGFGFVAAIVSLAAGVAALPHLLMRSATVAGVDAARRSAGWSLLFVLVVALTAPAYAAFAKLAILRDVVGTDINDLPDWIFTLGRLGLARICGVDAMTVQAVSAACQAASGTAGTLLAPDLAIAGDAIVLAWPEIVGLPYVFSALIAVGALAAALAAAGALAFAIGSALGHDLYARLIGVRASAGRHLAVTRLLLIATVLLAAWLAANRADDVLALALAAVSLSAGGLFPVLFLAVWWRRANATGAIAGMLAGFAVTAVMVAAARYPYLLALTPVDPRQLGLSELSAAIVGLPVGFIVIFAVSLLTAPPSRRQRATLDAIRRPGGAPFVQEGES